MARKRPNARRRLTTSSAATAVIAPPAPVAEATYGRIRRDIVFGRLEPGQKLTLDRMKEAYDTSVTTLREVLNRLSSEGLVVAEGARGEHDERRVLGERRGAWNARVGRWFGLRASHGRLTSGAACGGSV